MWYVMKGDKWIGIVESNYAWAVAYWTPRGFTLKENHRESY